MSIIKRTANAEKQKRFRDKQKDKGKVFEGIEEGEDLWKHCKYLAGFIYEAIGEVVISARKGMKWLQNCASILNKSDLPIYWTLPTGFVVKQKYLKMDAKRLDYDKIIKDILKQQPEVVFCNFVGEAIVHFYEAYADAGLDPSTTPIASLTTSENDVREMTNGVAVGHLTAAPYFQTINTPENELCVAGFLGEYGDCNRTDMCWEAAYFQVQIVANALKKTNSDNKNH